MSKKIITIDQEKCVGCGLCVGACRQGVIGLVDGKARLLRSDYCDGLGKCLPVCPVGAISFSQSKPSVGSGAVACDSGSGSAHWPIQIRLVPVKASFFKDAHLLVAADCVAFAHPSFRQQFMKNKITIIGCPKLDDVDYSVKLSDILRENSIKSLTVVRMEVPCCGGIANAARVALDNCGKELPFEVVTIPIGN